MPNPHSITTAFVVQWDDTIRLQAQQKESRLEGTVTDKGNIEGESFTANRIAALEDTPENNTRHGDTVWSIPDHSTRVAYMKDFFQAVPLDRADIPKLKVNPNNGTYMQSLLAAWNRRKDRIIFDALIGAAQVKDGGTVLLPASQIITAGGTAMTKEKIITARKIFRKNEADNHNGEELYIAYTSEVLESILSDTTLTNADFMAVKMLQEGDVAGKWLGINWIPYEAVKYDGSIYTTAMYAKSALVKGTGHIEGDVSRRPDKKNLYQTSMDASFGAVRVEEEKVVAIEFVE